jgi:dolichol-phosphate mannosyltransferase
LELKNLTNNKTSFFSKVPAPLLFSRFKRVLKFGTVGFSGVGVNAGLLFLLTERTGLDYRLSAIIAIELSIINNFLWNSIWTWRDKKTSCHIGLSNRFVKFHISCVFTAFLINYGLLILLTELFSIPYQISNLAGIAFGSILNFFLSHFWVFRHKAISNSN